MEELNKLQHYFNVANKNGGFNTVEDAAIVYNVLQAAKTNHLKLTAQLEETKKPKKDK